MSQYHTNRRQLVKKLKGADTCVYCGKTGSNSPDHIVPLAVYKWTGIGELEDYNSEDNLIASCDKCNYSKGCTVPTKSQALRLKVSCGDLYDKLHPAIVKYNNFIDRLMVNQKHKCGYCERYINKSGATIRRLNNKEKRSIDNSILLCNRCNARWVRIRKSILADRKE